MVVTRTAPALSTPNQAAESHWLLGPRRSTRLPGTTPRSSTSTWATRFAAATSASYDQVGRPGWCRHGRSPPWRAATSSSRAVAQLSRSGKRSSGRSNNSSGHWSAGGRWSRQKVSVWADGSSSMAVKVCPVRYDGQQCAIRRGAVGSTHQHDERQSTMWTVIGIVVVLVLLGLFVLISPGAP